MEENRILIEQKIKKIIRDVPDFPKKGILFKDITPLLQHQNLCSEIINELAVFYKNKKLNAIVGIESRGFLFGFALANSLQIPFVLIRKEGKLPYKKIAEEYDLEYGKAKIELQEDDIKAGWNVLIHDDLLATGGTAIAAAKLVKSQMGNVVGFSFLIELDFLNGREKLATINKNIHSFVNY